MIDNEHAGSMSQSKVDSLYIPVYGNRFVYQVNQVNPKYYYRFTKFDPSRLLNGQTRVGYVKQDKRKETKTFSKIDKVTQTTDKDWSAEGSIAITSLGGGNVRIYYTKTQYRQNPADVNELIATDSVIAYRDCIDGSWSEEMTQEEKDNIAESGGELLLMFKTNKAKGTVDGEKKNLGGISYINLSEVFEKTTYTASFDGENGYYRMVILGAENGESIEIPYAPEDAVLLEGMVQNYTVFADRGERIYVLWNENTVNDDGTAGIRIYTSVYNGKPEWTQGAEENISAMGRTWSYTVLLTSPIYGSYNSFTAQSITGDGIVFVAKRTSADEDRTPQLVFHLRAPYAGFVFGEQLYDTKYIYKGEPIHLTANIVNVGLMAEKTQMVESGAGNTWKALPGRYRVTFESVTVSSGSGGSGGGGGGSTSYTVSFDTRGGSAADSVSVSGNALLSKPQDPTKEGYTFADVDAESWYGKAVYWARKNGIVSGYSDEEFAPNAEITREQIAAILRRYAEFKGVSGGEKGNLSRFTDALQISDWAKEHVEWAVGAGLLSGRDNGTLDPTGQATRAEVAAVLQRFIEANQ